ncbi:MAG: hypothetical protein KDE48_23830 [Anaerolineales bacterium]|nr:hypothetical protein [Anaerolineales bacterium]
MHPYTDEQITAILTDYYAQEKWLQSLITDPTGSRFFKEKDAATQLRENHAKMARMRAFLDFAGNPQAAYQSVHVAGTSGKGSVVMMIAALLAEAGIKTGHHTSPYLQICNEKLVLNGRLITPQQFSALIHEFRQIYTAWQTQGNFLRYGDAWVALTYWWYARQKAEWLVMETGMGGRYDATNVLPSSLAVITNIDFDHMKSLGGTRASIAQHKAGIIRANSVTLTAVTDPEALPVIEAEARQKNSQLLRLGQDFDYRLHAADADGFTLSVQTPYRVYDHLWLPLLGTFQAQNAALAVTAVDVLREREGIDVGETAVRHILANLHLPGRMEIMQTNPIVILDSAHNPHKMQALAHSIKTFFPEKHVTVIMGVLVSKNSRPMVEAIATVADRFVMTEPNVLGKPAIPAAQLVDYAQNAAPATVVSNIKSVGAAIDLVLANSNPADIIIIAGSLYLAGEARDYWRPRQVLLRQLAASKR